MYDFLSELAVFRKEVSSDPLLLNFKEKYPPRYLDLIGDQAKK